jgi:phosphatidylethanolamine/phosphatidyl-N-methylethanolamine N-methyltransferase
MKRTDVSPGGTWNRVRYTVWAPIYDLLMGPVGFDASRRRSIQWLRLRPGDRVLLLGAGTGLDLAHLPDAVEVTAVDVTPAMLVRLQRRAARLGRAVSVHLMDGRQLGFPDESFDAVVLHLVLTVMPAPGRGLLEASRVLRQGGRVAIFDKFVRDGAAPSWRRRLLNLVIEPLFSDLTRSLGPLVEGTGLILERDDPAGFGGMYRVVTLRKPA